MKRISIILALALCLLPAAMALAEAESPSPEATQAQPAQQAEKVDKNETVYASLGYDGSVDSISVVNSFQVKGGDISDTAGYNDIINLTDGAEYEKQGDKITWKDAGAGKSYFYYQGTLSGGTLPWALNISYKLDGQAIDAEQLAGRSGKVEIALDVKAASGVDEYFSGNMMMQLSASLDMDRCKNVEAEGSTTVVAGSTQTVSFTILPGKSSSFTIAFDAEDFRMDGISANIIGYNMSSLGNLDEFTDGIDEMLTGIEDMTDGTRTLRDGLSSLSQGTGALKSGASKISGSRSSVEGGLQKLAQGLLDAKSGANQLSDGSSQFIAGMEELSGSSWQIMEGYNSLEGGLASMMENKEQLAALATAMLEYPDPQVVAMAQALLAYLDGTESAYGGISQLNPGLQQYFAGVESATSQYKDNIHPGIGKLGSGIGTISDNMPSLQSGIKQVFDGISSVNSGISELDSNVKPIPDKVDQLIDGQQQLKEGVEESKTKLEEALPSTSDAKPRSFSAEGIQVKSIQFVLRTPAIEKKTESVMDAEPETQKKNVADKLGELLE